MVDGKQVQRTFRGTEAAARKALRNLEFRAPEPVVPDPRVRTVGDLLTEWLGFQQTRGRSPKTVAEYERKVETRIRPKFGDLPLTALTAHDLDRAYAGWQAEGLSALSVHHHHAILSAALTQGVKWDWIPDSPARKASPPSPASTRKLVTPNREQVGQLISTAEMTDPMMAAAIALAWITGARRGELCALRWSDVEFGLIPIDDSEGLLEVATIRIERSLSEVGEQVTEKGTKTGRGRCVGIDGRSAALLRRYQGWQTSLSADAQSPLVEDPYVLSDSANAGRPVRPSIITDRFTKLRKAAKVEGVRFHDIRHAFGSEQIAAGTPVTTVSALMGHASTKMTLDRYSHALPAGAAKAATVMGSLLPASSGRPEVHRTSFAGFGEGQSEAEWRLDS
jgi:integrase